ncbi:protein FAM83C isoform X2 [Notolabrus celidotus]|uniref:protein FAM83C isoform X2 n=1 Tax=Notolabrus celidotus TaxID=1203425 RepID=UPI00148FEE81|nr:protein FAM83C isoform X2 [Notolabrus celidotus]
MISSEGLRPATSGRKPLGKLATRLEEVKNPWRQGSTLELSHNEAARLATDALLEHGEKEYRKVLAEERELNFLSPLEIRYITKNAAKAFGPESNGVGPNDPDFGDGDAVSELTSGTYFPMMSDEEPPMLELGWPDSPTRYGPSETQIYFQRDKSHNVKDLIRSLINKAKKVIAVVMDVFTDVDLLCDLMEAANKRRVPVYILLDGKNLDYFTDMCLALDIQNSHLSNIRIRSVNGDTYCTKSGKKFTGQVLEKFMIIDCEEVIAGSYSFTWLSSQVHSNMVMHFSGRIADSFDREFRCLYADSQIIDCFFNAEEEGMPYYPSYQAMMAPGTGMGMGPVMGLDLLSDRQRDRGCSENSSSQSSNSVSSVKAAPGMASNPVYKVTQSHDKKEPNNNPHLSPERRGGSGDRGGQTPTPQSHISSGSRGSANGVTNHSTALDRPPPPYGHQMGLEWNKPNPSDVMRSNIGGTSSKFQAMGLYDHKPGMFHNPGYVPGAPTSNMNPKPQTPSQLNDSKLNPKQRPPPNQFLNKLSDFFLPTPNKDAHNFRRSPSPHGTTWAGPELSQAEPESQQSPPPPPSPVTLMNRQDQKRMTLGHSKLDLVNQYNKMKTKQVYSRFELKTPN